MSPDAPLERQVRLPASPRSAGTGRRFVRDLLAEAGREQWSDAATLVVSELVTNAVLHGHSEVGLVARVHVDHVRLEVRDDNPVLPSLRSYDESATTGRGLELVAALTSSHGVESLGAGGKVVWCCVRDEGVREESPADEQASWGGLAALPQAGEDGALDVVLLALPPTLWLAAQEHEDGLLRELSLLRAGEPTALHVDPTAADSARALLDAAVSGALEHARRNGTAQVPLPADHPGALPSVPPSLDLHLAVRPEQASAFAELQDVLDEGERLAAADRLLLRPGLPEIVGVRDWACEQVIAQLGGAPAAPWPGTDDARSGDPAQGEAGPAGWDGRRVREADVGAIAVDDANRVVAVSQPLAQLLGWPVEELVGRRVVVIVPPRYREAHVAGFSRHLSTGQARALGVHLELPVLRADGSEVLCRFLIESEKLPGRHVVYVAQITPLS